MEGQADRLADNMNRSDEMAAFLATTNWASAAQVLVAGDASNRKYTRLTRTDGTTAIVMDAPPDKGEDVRPFVRIAAYLTGIGLSAPLIYEQDVDRGFLVIEDLGDDLFADLMAKDTDCERPLYRAATQALIQLHNAPALDLPLCDPAWLEKMNALVFNWYAPSTKPGSIAQFNAAFRPLAALLEQVQKVVILRDYHAQNLLWLPDRDGVAAVGQLDFQDALLGHPAYDLVSILQDARRDVDPTIEAEMIDLYLAETALDRDAFLTAYAILGAQRNLAILGIFARLCKRDGKPHYVDLIPRVWGYVQRNLAHPALHSLAATLDLPEPTPAYLQTLKDACPTSPS
jgi:aminoglycoside/choline kinase family phosphotransferase